jgi:hypothetical protein
MKFVLVCMFSVLFTAAACGGGGGSAGTGGSLGSGGSAGSGGAGGANDGGTDAAAGGGGGSAGSGGSSTDAAANNDAGDNGLAPGTCKAINAGSPGDRCAGHGPRLYLCDAPSSVAPEESCARPNSGGDMNFEFCCEHDLCTRQETIDYFCASKSATPKAVHCGTNATVPAGCVSSGSEIVNKCCP